MNMIQYVKEKRESFRESNMNKVDSLVFSQLAYLNFTKIAMPIRLIELGKRDHDSLFEQIRVPELNKELFLSLLENPRFKELEFLVFQEQISRNDEGQFAAIAFRVDGKIVCSYRGTDASIVGWKEDANLVFQYPVFSQKMGKEFLEKMFKEYPNDSFILTGHSKGGNIAFYSTMEASDEAFLHIEKVYSHDGPGFLKGVMEQEKYKRVVGKLEKLVPESSIFGLLMEHDNAYQIIRSSNKGIMQHDPFSWLVLNDDFIYLNRISRKTYFFDQTINDWIYALNSEERKKFLDCIFYTFLIADKRTFGDYFRDYKNMIPLALSVYESSDPTNRKMIIKTLMELGKILKVFFIPKIFNFEVLTKGPYLNGFTNEFNVLTVGAFFHEELVGIIAFDHEVKYLFVKPEYRYYKVATKLLFRAKRMLRRKGYKTILAKMNPSLNDFYLSSGFINKGAYFERKI